MRLLWCLLLAWPAFGAPTMNDSRLKISLLAAEPEIVTPVGLAVDQAGRVFVVESHTHFPKANYPGPKSDRIKIFHNGTNHVFADGFRAAMNLAFAPSGQLYLVHRNGVVILHDRDGDGKCEAQTRVVEMITKGDYPHNGLGGIAFSADGWLYLGMGENLGASYSVKGSDGSAHSGAGEGGNVFRCRPDGTRLQHVATGFWNAFALEFNRAGHLFCVDNDPDSRPPCRLLDVVMGGDYGYKFRFGRSGLHPFTAWNGELPGTLPMAGGTGEAPSGVLDCDRAGLPADYSGALLVTSWGDHTLEIFRPQPFGASVRAEREILAQGTDTFRPVGVAAAPDGTIYVTDWVDRDYSVHRKGRIWKITSSESGKKAQAPRLSQERKRMNALLESSSSGELFRALEDNDPFIRSAAVHALTKLKDDVARGLDHASARVRLGCVLAARRLEGELSAERFSKLLSDPSEDVRQIALLWIGEKKLPMTGLEKAVAGGNVSPALFRTYLATKEALSANPTNLQVFAFAPSRDLADAKAMLKTGARLEGVRALAELNTAPELLLEAALDRKNDSQVRAEAVVGLSTEPKRALPLLRDPDPMVQLEAVRCLQPIAAEVREPLQKLLRSTKSARVKRQIEFALHRTPVKSEYTGDAESGRRLFFNASVGCARCHRVEDFGGHIGPDLSVIARASDRAKLLQSILEPSREIAPQFVQHVVETTEGESWSGLLTSQGKDGSVTLTASDGRAVMIPSARIRSHTTSKVSLMPEGLHQAMSPDDIEDLLTFLASRK